MQANNEQLTVNKDKQMNNEQCRKPLASFHCSLFILHVLRQRRAIQQPTQNGKTCPESNTACVRGNVPDRMGIGFVGGVSYRAAGNGNGVRPHC